MPPTTACPSNGSSSIQLLNLPAKGILHQRLFLLIGRARPNDPQQRNRPDGFINVTTQGTQNVARGHSGHDFASHSWEINAGWFKCLIPLRLGDNKIRLSCQSSDGRDLDDSTEFVITCQETQAPRLHLLCLFSKDSPGLSSASVVQNDKQGTMSRSSPEKGFSSFLKKTQEKLANTRLDADHSGAACIDAPPGPVQDHISRTGRDSVRRRLAIQGYMWQAWHSEQMHRHGFGHRTFRLVEKPETAAVSQDVLELSELADVKCLVSERSLKEFRDPNNAQQKQGATNGGAMHSFAGETIDKYVKAGQLEVRPGDALGVCIVDATWDSSMQLLRAHAAVGSFAGISPKSPPSYGVMGSHWLWSAPEQLCDVTKAFLDTTRTDERHCANDLGEGKTASLTLNIGAGAMLHEVGHAMSNPHYNSGVMARGYIEYNRAFMTRENHSLRDNNSSQKPLTPDNDSKDFHIHRCQAVRAFYHPLFSHPGQPAPLYMSEGTDKLAWMEAEPLWKPTARGPAVSCDAGLAMLEIEVGDKFKTHIEWIDNGASPGHGHRPPKSTLLTRDYIAQMVGFDPCSPGSEEIKITAVGCNLRSCSLDSYRRFGFAQALTHRELPGVDFQAYGRSVRRGPQSRQDDAQDHARFIFLLHTSFPSSWSPPRLEQVDIFGYDHAPTGIGFKYSNGQSQLAGIIPPGSSAPRDTLRLQPGEHITQLAIRSGAWVDAVQVVLSSGKKSRLIGGQGGGVRTLDAGQGEEIVGFTATTGAWLDSIGLLVADRR